MSHRVVVRFADGRDDVCLDPVPPQTTVRELRRRIAASEPALADKFLRLVFRGRILKAEDTLTSLTASLEAQGSAGDAAVAAPPAHTAAPDSKALPLFLHCSVSDERPLSSHQVRASPNGPRAVPVTAAARLAHHLCLFLTPGPCLGIPPGCVGPGLPTGAANHPAAARLRPPP
nr:hypothetical protein HK105_001522 [Polyrhizophydium stewartii]